MKRHLVMLAATCLLIAAFRTVGQTAPTQCQATPIQCPVETGCTVSGPGGAFQRDRVSPVDGVVRNHNGTDFVASEGTNIVAAATGKVERSYPSSSYGETVIIRHADGGATLYAHLKSRAVADGADVTAGQVIGQADSTGRSTGSHLHFEYVPSGAIVLSPNRIDPQPCISTGGTGGGGQGGGGQGGQGGQGTGGAAGGAGQGAPEVFAGAFAGTLDGPLPNRTSANGCQYDVSFSGSMTLTFVANPDGTIVYQFPSVTGTNTISSAAVYSPPGVDCAFSPIMKTGSGVVEGGPMSVNGTFGAGAFQMTWAGTRDGNTMMVSGHVAGYPYVGTGSSALTSSIPNIILTKQ